MKQETSNPVDHPLTRWRRQHGWTQRQLADACELSQATVAHIENYQRVPVRGSLERLMNVTGLPAEALVLPERFLAEHPDFLGPTSTPERMKRGRPRKS
jgi:transcriptional regulator with XRE-family HTH domain